MVWAAVALGMCYALVLSASRSGFLALVFLCLFVIWRSKHRAAWLAVAVLGATLALALMTDLQRERYVSIFSHSAKGGATAELRITGVIGDLKVLVLVASVARSLACRYCGGETREFQVVISSRTIFIPKPQKSSVTSAWCWLGLIDFARVLDGVRQVVGASAHDR